MSDIVGELQRVAYSMFKDGWQSPDLHARAALEILRLRAELASIRSQARREMAEEILGALTAHELYQYGPKAFDGFIEYARRLAEQEVARNG